MVKRAVRSGLAIAVLALPGCGGESGRSGASSTAQETPPPETKVAVGALFPHALLRTLTGDSIDTASLIEGRESLVVFIEVGCEACEEFLTAWSGNPERVAAAGLNVFGIADEEPAFARRYAEEKHVPFPLYCDERGTFAGKYGIHAYPTVAGLYDDGYVAYVGRGVNREFTPEKAKSLLEDMKKQRAARSQGAPPPR